jgi:hypothetical protein
LKRTHTLLIALALGAAAAVGLFAATRTVDLAAANEPAQLSDGAVRARTAKLDHLERSLHKALLRRPPKLPKVPEVAPSASRTARSTSAGGGVVYVQSGVNVSPSSNDDDGGEYETEDAGDMEHGGDD